jgi:hypothetical protein
MSAAELHTFDPHDPDFDRPRVKSGEVPTSKLAVLSLVMGIVGFFVPVFGSVVAIVTGHVALGEIRQARGALEGRSLAKVGLILGYLWLVLAAIAFALVMVLMTYRVEVVGAATRAVQSGSYGGGPAWTAFAEPGVKLANELTPSYAEWLREEGLIGDGEHVVVAYESPSGPPEGPEFAVVTSRRVIYVKKGNVTVVDLADVADVAAGPDFAEKFGGGEETEGKFLVGIRTEEGPSMRVQIEGGGGEMFAHQLGMAWEKAKEDGHGGHGAMPETAHGPGSSHAEQAHDEGFIDHHP